MNAPYPRWQLCDRCRPAWIAWRDADYDPASPNKWGSIMDERSSHADRRRWREELQRSQLQLIVDVCRTAGHRITGRAA